MSDFHNSVVSNYHLEPMFSLGSLHISDFLKPAEKEKYEPCELQLAFDPVSKLVQLTKQPPKEAMWGSQYWYLSKTNPQMRIALNDVAFKTISCIPESNKKEIYLDIAGNDSTLLSFVDKNKFTRINIDPSEYEDAKANCDILIKDFFSKEAFLKSGYKKARYVSCCAMLYDLSNPNEFLHDVFQVMEDDGVFVVQLSYTPLMLLQNEAGNIVHEHLCYYNLTSLKYLFEKNQFIIRDVELNNVNGGSIRIYVQKNNQIDNFKSPSDEDISHIKINSLLEWEEKNGYNSINKYMEFFNRINILKEKTIDFIKSEKEKGKSIYGYGASTKASTVYQFFGLNNFLISGIVEAQARKVSRVTSGTNIPIISEEEMRKIQPDYLLIGPWFFLESFKKREKNYLDKGGAFILTSPRFNIFKK